jgi:peptidylprolyl isomerase
VAPAAPGLPAVARATDLKVAPIIAPGKPPPPTKLTTRDLVVGSGQAAGPDSKVTVQYVGTSYPTGKVFDSSWARGQAATFTLTGVVPGFQQGIVGMKPGGRREITIPPGLGYGASGQPPVIQPNETLVFVVDLKAIG